MKAIVKKVEKKFWIAQAIAALMGLSAIIVWAQCPGLLLLAEVLGAVGLDNMLIRLRRCLPADGKDVLPKQTGCAGSGF